VAAVGAVAEEEVAAAGAGGGDSSYAALPRERFHLARKTMTASNCRNRIVSVTPWAVASALLLIVSTGCSAERGRAFASPQEGVSAFVGALRPLNLDELRVILGPEAEEVVCSGDEVADRSAAEDFVAMYERKHNIVVEKDTATLVVGEDDWPMPIPLVSDGQSWWFDTDEGKDEMLARRIGRNELSAIETCRAIVDAQHEYAAVSGSSGEPVYAQKFASDAGQRNGLYWPTNPGEPESPLGAAVAEALAEGYGGKGAADAGPRPFHGYCFRMLTAQGKAAPGGARNFVVNGRMTGGFGVVAWPVEYGNSGIMTIVVSNRGVVYQKDLEKKTAKRAAEITAFDPDSDWEIVP
jgi:hypothetical protein